MQVASSSMTAESVIINASPESRKYLSRAHDQQTVTKKVSDTMRVVGCQHQYRILNYYNICQSSSEHECYIKYNHVPSCFRNLIIILHAKYSLFSNNFRPCLLCIAVFSLPVVYIRDSGTRVTIKVPKIYRMYNIQLSLGLKSLASALNTNRPLPHKNFLVL